MMNTLTRLSILTVVSSVLFGCASAPTQQSEASKHYSKGLTVYSLSEGDQWQTKTCPKAVGNKWKESSWKNLIQMANGCVVEKNWTQLEEVGNHLSRQDHLAPWGPYYLSLAAEARKDYSRALWMVDLALKKSPASGLLSYQKGRIVWALEDYTQAIELFEQALAHDPKILDAHMMLGQVYYRDQDFKKAQKHFTEVLSKDGSNYIALVGMAECELKAGRTDKALSLFTRAVGRNPADLSLRLRVAFVHETVAQNLPEALQSFKDIQSLMKRGKLMGSLSFDLTGKIKDLESTLSKLASAEPARKTASDEKVAK